VPNALGSKQLDKVGFFSPRHPRQRNTQIQTDQAGLLRHRQLQQIGVSDVIGAQQLGPVQRISLQGVDVIGPTRWCQRREYIQRLGLNSF